MPLTAAEQTLANMRIFLWGSWGASAIPFFLIVGDRRKRGLATRGYQDLPAPTRSYRTPSGTGWMDWWSHGVMEWRNAQRTKIQDSKIQGRSKPQTPGMINCCEVHSRLEAGCFGFVL